MPPDEGVRLGRDGYVVEATGERRMFPAEKEVYAALGLEYITPELREGNGEIEAARQGTLPDLITQENIKGDLHVHTEWSDGADSIRDVAMAARALGYEYVAMCDHSPSLHIANGLSVDRLREQMAAIDEMNDTLENFTVLKGSEVDILADGSLDLPDDVLEDLDIVVGSVHSKMRQEPDVITRRVITALENERLTILAHPTSRILGRREPMALDMDRVIEAAKEHGKVLEVNAYPDRLDLSDEHVRKAMDAGVMISIDTDAHSTPELCFMEYGVHNARRGWATKSRTLNTLTYDALTRVPGPVLDRKPGLILRRARDRDEGRSCNPAPNPPETITIIHRIAFLLLIMIRTFVAVNMDPAIRARIGEAEKDFDIKGVKLVDPELIHITLKFLGYVEEGRIDEIADALKKVKVAPFTARTDRSAASRTPGVPGSSG